MDYRKLFRRMLAVLLSVTLSVVQPVVLAAESSDFLQTPEIDHQGDALGYGALSESDDSNILPGTDDMVLQNLEEDAAAASENSTIILFDDADVGSSGSCGTDMFWSLTEDGELVISGTGAMENYSNGTAPWYSLQEQIKTVTVQSGVTTIGDYAFYVCTALTAVTFPDVLTTIGNSAFYNCSRLSAAFAEGTVVLGSGNNELQGVLHKGLPHSLEVTGIPSRVVLGMIPTVDAYVTTTAGERFKLNTEYTLMFPTEVGSQTVTAQWFGLTWEQPVTVYDQWLAEVDITGAQSAEVYVLSAQAGNAFLAIYEKNGRLNECKQLSVARGEDNFTIKDFSADLVDCYWKLMLLDEAYVPIGLPVSD